MPLRTRRAVLAALPALLLGAGVGPTAFAQTFPIKPVRLIVPNTAGSGTDIGARRLAARLTSVLGQSFFVENKPGAGGAIGVQAMLQAPRDGYTLAVVSNNHVILPHLVRNLGFDAIRDIVPIAWVSEAPLVVVARPEFPASDIRQLKDLAGTRTVSFGSSGNGTITHLSGVQLMKMGGFRMTHIPYKGSGANIPDLVSGVVDVGIFAPSSVQALIADGKLKALAITGATRLSALPAVPTIAETLPGYSQGAWSAVIGPAGMPAAIVQRLNLEIGRVLAEPDFKAWLASVGNETRSLSPEEAAREFAREYERFGVLIRESGATVD